MVNRGGVGAVLARGRAAVAFLCLILGVAFLLRHDLSSQPPAQTLTSSAPVAAASLGRLPLAFEPNQGQSDPEVRFQARGNGYGLYLTDKAAVLTLPVAGEKARGAVAAVRMHFAGANQSAEITGTERLPGHSNYFIGNDPSKWHRNIPQFSRVRYRDLYSGVDLDFYGKQGKLEYDFEVNPGADPSQISLDLAGADSVQVASNGDLVIALDGRELRFQAPHVYQTATRGMQNIDGKFVLRGDRVGFVVGDYDRSRTLVIDPILSFSTYLGGSGSESCSAITGAAFIPQCPGIAVDAAARIYIAGATTSTAGWPASTAAPSSFAPLGGNSDVFVARVSSAGSSVTLDFLTFIGGSGTDYPTGVAVDSGFNVYVAGTTNSQDYPTINGFQDALTSPTVQNHAFFTKLDSSGSQNLYSTYISGSGIDTSSSLAVDTQGRAYVFGTTTSQDLATTLGALQAHANSTNQFFFIKLNPTVGGPNSLLYWTYIGGSNPANGVVLGGGVAVDTAFNVYLAGGTSFQDMPAVNAFQGVSQGGSNVWAARLNAPANNTQQYTPLYETYLGGPGDANQVDVAYGVATDGTNTYITGSTNSGAFTSIIPSTTTAFQSAYGGGTSDAFVARFSTPSAATSGGSLGTVPLIYFSYLGGSAQDVGLAIVADSTSNARVTGFTTSGNFSNLNPLTGVGGGGTDAFFARIVTSGTTALNTSSTSILGGSGTDIGTSTAVDPSLNSYVAGETTSAEPGSGCCFPATSGAFQTGLAGSSDTFVSKLVPNTSGLTFVCPTSVTGCPNPTPANPTVSPSPVGVGGQVTFKYSIYNLGDPVTGVVFTDTATNSTVSSITPGTGSACSPNSGGGSAVCNLGTVNSSTTSTSGTTTTIQPTTVTVVVNAATPTSTGTVPPPQPPDVGNVGVLSVIGTSFQTNPQSGAAKVNDFVIQATPGLQTVTAGNEAAYTITATPSTNSGFPGSVSLSCGSGLPTGAQCQFASNPIPNLNGAVTRILDITTQPRVTTPASLFHRGGPFYAFWLPIGGLALVGGASRKRRWLMAALIAFALGATIFQAACSNSSSTSITTGTPAGTYTVPINATSNGATRTAAVQLVVQ